MLGWKAPLEIGFRGPKAPWYWGPGEHQASVKLAADSGAPSERGRLFLSMQCQKPHWTMTLLLHSKDIGLQLFPKCATVLSEVVNIMSQTLYCIEVLGVVVVTSYLLLLLIIVAVPQLLKKMLWLPMFLSMLIWVFRPEHHKYGIKENVNSKQYWITMEPLI